MASARGLEGELAAVHHAGALPAEQALPALRKALASANNLIVSTAAKYIGRLKLSALAEDLATAFFASCRKRVTRPRRTRSVGPRMK